MNNNNKCRSNNNSNNVILHGHYRFLQALLESFLPSGQTTLLAFLMAVQLAQKDQNIEIASRGFCKLSQLSKKISQFLQRAVFETSMPPSEPFTSMKEPASVTVFVPLPICSKFGIPGGGGIL